MNTMRDLLNLLQESVSPQVHTFDSSGDAYDASQMDQWYDDDGNTIPVRTGDILVIPSEGVVGVSATWPCAVTRNAGKLHSVKDEYSAPEEFAQAAKVPVQSVQLAIKTATDMGFETVHQMVDEIGQAATPDTDQILYYLTAAWRTIANMDKDNFGEGGLQTLNTVYELLREPLLKGDLAAFEAEWNRVGGKYVDAFDFFVEEVFAKAGLGHDGTYEDFMEKCSSLDEKAPPGMEDVVMKLKKQYPNDHSKAFATAWSIYNKKHGKAEESVFEEPESPAQVVSCNQDNPENAAKACAMENASIDNYSEEVRTALAYYEELVMWRHVEPERAHDYVIDGMTPEQIAEFNSALQQIGDEARSSAEKMTGDTEFDDIPFEEDMKVQEKFDLNNGYDEVHDAKGSDYFPTGADGPVVAATGPSGARQGDNPEQKKMQVTEIHQELVYGYRKYLGESANEQIKKKD